MIKQNVLDYFTDSYHETFRWPEMSAPVWDRKIVEYSLTFKPQLLGDLGLPTGRIVASDPLVFFDQPPFVAEVPPGRYEVIVSVASIANVERVVAFAMLKFGSLDRIASWKHLETHQWPGGPGGQTSHYGVDSGTGCFMDLATQTHLSELLQDPAYDEFFCEELQKPYSSDKFCWLNHTLAGHIENNVIAFTSGWGDGGYSTYAGIDSANKPACFITDFDIVHYIDETG